MCDLCVDLRLVLKPTEANKLLQEFAQICIFGLNGCTKSRFIFINMPKISIFCFKNKTWCFLLITRMRASVWGPSIKFGFRGANYSTYITMSTFLTKKLRKLVQGLRLFNLPLAPLPHCLQRNSCKLNCPISYFWEGTNYISYLL